VLIIDDLPRTANEPDIVEAFPNIVSIVIDRYTAYAKFASHEFAKITLENKFIHFIRNKRVFLDAGSLQQFNDLVGRLGKFDNPEYENKQPSENGESQQSFESRDPRQRPSSNNSNSGPSTPVNFIKTDCVIIKNMEPQTNIEDVERFFNDIGIYKMRVHILLDRLGNPAGDCFVEFKFPNDSHRAISKNNQFLNKNRVQVMLIPREQVDAVLSSFGGDDFGGSNSSQNSKPVVRDWAPPSDFGEPETVVMISNMSYRASIDLILEEFKEFNLTVDQVIRRFNDHGQPTGNACINFNSAEDATRAMDLKNGVKILNRPIYLKRV